MEPDNNLTNLFHITTYQLHFQDSPLLQAPPLVLVQEQQVVLAVMKYRMLHYCCMLYVTLLQSC